MMKQVDKKMDRNYYFTVPSRDRELRLTFNRDGQTVNIKIHPQAKPCLQIFMMNGSITIKRGLMKKEKDALLMDI